MDLKQTINENQVRERINNLLQELTDGEDIAKVQELSLRFEITVMLRRLLDVFPTSSVVKDNNGIPEIIRGICNFLKIEPNNINANELLQLLPQYKEKFASDMKEILQELQRIETEKLQHIETEKIQTFNTIFEPSKPNYGWRCISDEQELKFVVTNILKNAGIIADGKNVIDQEKVNLLAKAGREDNMTETLNNLGIDLSEWDTESKQRIQDAIYGQVAITTTHKEFTTVSHESEPNNQEAEQIKAKCTRVVNLLTPEEISKLKTISNAPAENDNNIENAIKILLESSENYERIKQIINMDDDEILLKIAGMCYMHETTYIQSTSECLVFRDPIQFVRHIINDDQLNVVTNTILENACIIADGKNVIDQEKVNLLAKAGLEDNMTETLNNLGIDLSEWDTESQQRIQDAIYEQVAIMTTHEDFTRIPPEPVDDQTKENQKRNSNALARIVKLLTPDERSQLIEHYVEDENIKAFTENFLSSVTNALEIQEILNEHESFYEIIVPALAGGCYMAQQIEWGNMAKTLLGDLKPEDRMLVAQEGKRIECKGIEDEKQKLFIIGEVKKLCKEEMENLDIDQFCNTLLKLLSNNQKLQLALEEATIKDFVNIDSNPYYNFMFNKLGYSEIQNKISQICWEHREEYDLSPMTKTTPQILKEFLGKPLKRLITLGANIGRVVINSIFSPKESAPEIDETETPTPHSRRNAFGQKIKEACKREPTISAKRKSSLKAFLQQARKDLNRLLDELRSPLSDLDDDLDPNDDLGLGDDEH